MKFYTYKKTGTKRFGVVLTRVPEVLTTLEEGGGGGFPTFQRGGGYLLLPCLRGVGAQLFHFIALPGTSIAPPPFPPRNL